MGRVEPFFDLCIQSVRMLRDSARRDQIAGRPVVDIGQKLIEQLQRTLIIVLIAYQQSVQVVFVVVYVPRIRDKFARGETAAYLRGVFAQPRNPDSKYPLERDIRHEPALESSVLLVGERTQPVGDIDASTVVFTFTHSDWFRHASRICRGISSCSRRRSCRWSAACM